MASRTNESTLTSKGQTTIPAKIRKALHLKPGDTLEYYMQGDVVVVQPKTVQVCDLANLIPRSSVHQSIEKINQSIVKAALGCME